MFAKFIKKKRLLIVLGVLILFVGGYLYINQLPTVYPGCQYNYINEGPFEGHYWACPFVLDGGTRCVAVIGTTLEVVNGVSCDW